MKTKIQSIGKALSGMVMPNIGAFIAWGLLAALFMPTGWIPNESLARLISPMITYMLPLLIAYTAGYNISGIRGGVIAVIASMGVIVGGDIPMFIGVMIVGPFSGWLIKKSDASWAKRTPAGFEMLINNFSLGILGLLMLVIGLFSIGPFINFLTLTLKGGVDWVMSHGILPLVAVFVEPAKVLFLNNAINHGIFSPIGILQSESTGQSIMFLIESNPGPGLGVLLAYSFFGKGAIKSTAPGAAVIHFFGGIHEIYFPYILSNPKVILAPILGSISSIAFFSIMDVGLVAPASPGSIIALLMMAMKSKWLLLLLGVLIATTVSFLTAAFFVRHGSVDRKEQVQIKVETGKIKKIVFACDAGMGSSAMGASRFRNRIKKYDTGVEVTHSAVNSIPGDADVVVCQKAFRGRCLQAAPDIRLIEIKDFLLDENLDILFDQIVNQKQIIEVDKNKEDKEPASNQQKPAVSKPMFAPSNILIDLPGEDKDAAIKRAGNLLAELGYTQASYADAMLERERISSTYMGMGIAIPHGTKEAKETILSSGFVLLQYRDGIDFDGEPAHLVIGVAGVGDEHLDILSRLASVLDDEALLSLLVQTSDKELILDTLTKEH